MGAVPVIDLTGPSVHVSRAIDRACRDVGFFQIVGHDLDGATEAAAWSEAAAFFELDLAEKLAVRIPNGDAYGYAPDETERLAASLGDETPPDLKETFSVGPRPDATNPIHDPAAAFVFSATPWPISRPEMPEVMHAYADDLARFAARLMGLMAIGLGLDADHFAPMIDRHTSALRLLHYPELTDRTIEPGQLRAGAHTDYGTVTLLRQDDAPAGLQVCDRFENWHDVPQVEGAYVVNVGDALERWTNGWWRSTLHRVVVPPVDGGRGSSRQSIAFFHNANWDTVIDCLPGCNGPSRPPRYEPVTAGEHLMQKFRRTR